MEWIMTFHSVGNVIIPTDELHDFSEGWRKNNQLAININMMQYYQYIIMI
jgi:hypothetical protein